MIPQQTGTRKVRTAGANQRTACIACGSSNVEPFFEVPRAPVQCNVLWPTREQALAVPTGTIDLGFCRSCGHIFNTRYDPTLMEYTEHYENSLHFSPRFQTFLDSLISGLDDRYALNGKNVIDVGCGKGEFLNALSERTGCYGIGFDRAYKPGELEGNASPRTRFVVDFYDDRYADCPADLITCRHVLEHIDRPVEFVAMIRRTIGERRSTGVFFEVPNVLYTVRDLGIWDIIYEHVSYFTPQSLRMLFERNGFTATRLASEFDDQYLTLDAVPRDENQHDWQTDADEIAAIEREVSRFRDRYEAKRREWKAMISKIGATSTKAVLWGTGSKGATFLNALEITGEIEYAVDVNPRKTGMHVPGTGQKVVTPEFLTQYRPELVIVMNAIYEEEIKGTLSELNIPAKVMLA